MSDLSRPPCGYFANGESLSVLSSLSSLDHITRRLGLYWSVSEMWETLGKLSGLNVEKYKNLNSVKKYF